MSLHGPELVGRRFSSSHRNHITAEALTAFARAIGARADLAPPTFLITFSVRAAEEFLPSLGFDWSRVVHGEQRFKHYRNLKVDDLLSSVSEIESYKSMAGNEFVTVRTDFAESESGDLVSSTWSTLVFRGAPA